MKHCALLLCLLIATVFAHGAHAAAVNLQTCTVTPTSGGLIGCPDGSVKFAPVSEISLVRSQVNSVQAWRPYAALQPADLVVAQSDGSWHPLGSLTVATTGPIVTPPATPVPPTPPVVPLTVSWVPMNWSCSIANNVATCTAPITP